MPQTNATPAPEIEAFFARNVRPSGALPPEERQRRADVVDALFRKMKRQIAAKPRTGE